MICFRLASGRTAWPGLRRFFRVFLVCLAAGLGAGTSGAAGSGPAVAFVQLETGPDWREPDCDPQLAAHERARLHLEASGIATRSVITTPGGAEADLRALAGQGTELVAVLSPGLFSLAAAVAGDAPRTAFLVLTDAEAPPAVSTFQARSYEGWYLAGREAGRLAERQAGDGEGPALVGWLAPEDGEGRLPAQEVRNLNAFTLGARSVRPDMHVLALGLPAGASRSAAASAVARLAAEAAAGGGKALLVLPPCLAGTPVPDGIEVSLLPGPDWNWNNMYGSLLTQLRFGLWRQRAVWYGMKEGVVLFGKASGPDAASDREVTAALRRGAFSPFTGPVRDAAGRVRLAEGETASDEALRSMDWLAEGIRNLGRGPDSPPAAP